MKDVVQCAGYTLGQTVAGEVLGYGIGKATGILGKNADTVDDLGKSKNLIDDAEKNVNFVEEALDFCTKKINNIFVISVSACENIILISIDAKKIKFTQNSIASKFKNGTDVSDLIAGLKNGSVDISKISPVRRLHCFYRIFNKIISRKPSIPRIYCWLVGRL